MAEKLEGQKVQNLQPEWQKELLTKSAFVILVEAQPYQVGQ